MKKIIILVATVLLALSLNFHFMPQTPVVHAVYEIYGAKIDIGGGIKTAANWTWGELKDAFGSDVVDEPSFQDFEGGLQVPSTAGYAPGLTQVTSARELIIKIVNFALGFLGLIAVIIIIYGGIRYVTSGGESGGVEKGKKSIMYAALGLLIVVGSYAIVNTVLQAPTGETTGAGTGGTASKNVLTTDISQTMLFSVDQIANIPKAIITVYSVYSKNKVDFLTLQQVAVEAGRVSPFDSVDNMQKAFDGVEASLKNSQNRLQEIARRSPKTSVIQERSAQFTLYINAWLSALNSEVLKTKQATECSALSDAKCKTQGIEASCADTCKQTISGYSTKFKASVDELLNYLTAGSGTPPSIEGKSSSNFMDVSYKAFEADNDAIVDSSVDKIQKSLKDLRDSVSAVSSEMESLFAEIDQLLATFKNPSSKEITELKASITATMEKVQELQTKLQNIKFVQVYLTADSTEGNSPFIVNFDTRGTVDPSGKTVQDSSIKWDLDGNGTFDEFKNALGCSEKMESKPRAVATCIYNKPGTYRVNVKVDSTDKTIAGGMAYLTIKVLPPKARIKLKATVYKGGAKIPVILKDYDENGFVTVDRPRLTITLTQGKNGVDFDASGTTSSSAAQISSDTTATTIQRIKWDFGDTTETVEGEPVGPNLAPKHYYTQTGEYVGVIEVTDKNNVKDRKVFVVSVSSIAALIDISPVPTGKTQTLFTVNGENSSSDNGQITGYEWSLAPDINSLGKIDKSLFSTKFGKPNTYLVTLKVTDTQSNEATDTAEIKIESAPPVAKFSYSVPKANQPAIVQFDGGKTYDPDGPNKDITYSWTIEAEATDYKFVSGDASAQKPLIKFNKIGTYKITLRVSDKNEPDKSTENTQEISITNLLDIEWAAQNTTSMNLDTKGEAKANFAALSENATGYDFDFGDSGTESGVPANGKIEASHTYKQSGTYKITVTVTDDSNNKNSISRKVVIGGSQNPVAIIKLLINNEEYFDTSAAIEVSRKDVVTLDATNSINTDGTKKSLVYQWDFGDGKKSTKNIAVYTYKELSKKDTPYSVTLKVSDSSDPTKSSTDMLKISVVSMKPTFKSIIAIPEAIELKTPLKVDISAIEPNDSDGRIISYKWWYFDTANPEEKLGEQITQTPNTIITIGTKGNEGDTHKYKFSVALTDDENQMVSAEDVIGVESLPELEVINGPNKAPIAKFSIDKTNIKVGESITFSSSSTDPDGKIATYIWDTDGTGFAGKAQTQKSTTTVLYDKPAADGIQVRLKVIDDNFAESISDPVTIYILSKAQPPRAAFTSTQTEGTREIKFKNNSTADDANSAKIEKYIWDFDTIVDKDGDGTPDNDTDSTEKEPSFTYSAFGTFYAKLTVTDNFGNKNSITNPVILKSVKSAAPSATTGLGTDINLNFGNIAPGLSGGGASGVPKTIDLKVKTNPAPDPKDGKIHLAGVSGYIEFSFAESTGDIVKITVDKNIYFDSDNDGQKDNDTNFQTASKTTPWKTDFQSSWGKTAVKITAYDKNNNVSSVFREIVFDPTTKAGSTNVFVVPGSAELVAALAGMLGFGIVSVSAFRRKNRKR